MSRETTMMEQLSQMEGTNVVRSNLNAYELMGQCRASLYMQTHPQKSPAHNSEAGQKGNGVAVKICYTVLEAKQVLRARAGGALRLLPVPVVRQTLASLVMGGLSGWTPFFPPVLAIMMKSRSSKLL
jgi:hypothetical protein